MPDIPGLPSLLTMLFTPVMELRLVRHTDALLHLYRQQRHNFLLTISPFQSTNEERTCYTGALCGLGWNSQMQEGILPEHDIELAFDVKFDVEDVTEVTALTVIRERCAMTSRREKHIIFSFV